MARASAFVMVAMAIVSSPSADVSANDYVLFVDADAIENTIVSSAKQKDGSCH